MAMVAADAVFLPTAALLWMGARASDGRKRLLSRLGRPGAGADGSPGADGESQSAVPRQRSGENVSVR
jgi:hypothetical protein